MSALKTSDHDLAVLLAEAAELATNYWASLEERQSYPSTSGAETSRLFDRPWWDQFGTS